MINYLKFRYKEFLLVLLFFIVFYLASYIYNINFDMVLYISLIMLYFLLIILGLDYIKIKKNIKLIKKAILENNLAFLPAASSLYEEEYQNIIKTLNDNLKVQISSYDKQFNEILDYYSLWAHQIKTPIQALKLLVNDEDASYQIFKIEQYIETVMQYLRVDSLTTDLIYKKYNLDYLLKNSIKKYAKLFIRSGIKLKYNQIDKEIITDEKWFCFVIEQLLSNSLKYCDKGEIRIYLEDNNLVIEDNGIGIKAEDIPRIFEKGYTGYNGRLNGKSSGIGLFLCKKIINKLGYSISLKSEENIGTKIYIMLH